jgi:hypothetical protein
MAAATYVQMRRLHQLVDDAWLMSMLMNVQLGQLLTVLCDTKGERTEATMQAVVDEVRTRACELQGATMPRLSTTRAYALVRFAKFHSVFGGIMRACPATGRRGAWCTDCRRLRDERQRFLEGAAATHAWLDCRPTTKTHTFNVTDN